ncbi:tRNA isopentenyltransferase [Sporormia fimetaria CBS 119925]|uniref:tRNA dimethylallyltransferase n=1 Tax=Sporormia fimetaria CBS 119925 TaxID=1340428 RepID=A0A6A6V8Q1_9PLEO|nr:tRNA isopentenyltransferase [Sporormia fimetaria CBS 119925]
MPLAPVKPLVAIIGATGTGKSDLAVDIARRYNGEIINGDAMQLYHGLPIITNKITSDEMKGVPHHLLGRIGLEEETWTVGRFVENALEAIQDIRDRGKLPILVGGTHYYTQSLLFEDILADQSGPTDTPTQRFPILDEPTEVILERLREVDPVMADRWHMNDRRKIQRSLEIYLKTGKPASQIYEEQRANRESSPNADSPDSATAPGLRFPTLLFWVHASKDILNPRLDARILKMLDRGLLDEVQSLSEFQRTYEAEPGIALDQTRGIWVSIGYKEFIPYQTALSSGQASASELEKLKKAAIEKTQAATRQYAKRQLRWIQIKLLNALFGAGQKHSLFLLDGSDLSQWEEMVLRPAEDITGSFLSGNPLPEPTSLSALANEMLVPKRDYDLAQRPDLWKRRTCETCGTVAVNENDWKLHINSRAHRRRVNGSMKKDKNRKNGRSKNGEPPEADDVDALEAYQVSPDKEAP